MSADIQLTDTDTHTAVGEKSSNVVYPRCPPATGRTDVLYVLQTESAASCKYTHTKSPKTHTRAHRKSVGLLLLLRWFPSTSFFTAVSFLGFAAKLTHITLLPSPGSKVKPPLCTNKLSQFSFFACFALLIKINYKRCMSSHILRNINSLLCSYLDSLGEINWKEEVFIFMFPLRPC